MGDRFLPGAARLHGQDGAHVDEALQPVFFDHLASELVVEPRLLERFELLEQALAQVARRDARRVEVADEVDRPLDLL